MRGWMVCGALMLAMSSPALADDGRGSFASSGLAAVSAVNAKLEGIGGQYADEGMGALAGSLSIPLGHRYGLQVDGLAGSWNGDGLYGVGAHLFWRDPSRALFGIYGDHVHWDGLNGHSVSRLALESELYLGRFSLEGMAGVEFGELEDRFYSRGNIAYYPGDNLRLYAGHRYQGEESLLAVGTEWQMASAGVSLFADALFGDDHGTSVLGGIRLYAAPTQKSLIRRHREDDPANDLKDAVNSLNKNMKGGDTTTCPDGLVWFEGECVPV